MNDLTLLYYSAHSLPAYSEDRIRSILLDTVGDTFPIISVTQKPIEFGENICVGDIGKSHYNCYKQIYIGAQHVKTKYVAMIEDDTLYNIEHFMHRPSTDISFAYNKSMWFLEKDRFWHKWQTGMFACIAQTDALIAVLEERFTKFPVEPLPRKTQRHYWQEPGKDARLGLKNRKIEHFSTVIPLITMNYFDGLDGKKKSVTHKPATAESVAFWGKAPELMKRIWSRS